MADSLRPTLNTVAKRLSYQSEHFQFKSTPSYKLTKKISCSFNTKQGLYWAGYRLGTDRALLLFSLGSPMDNYYCI